MFPDRSPAHRRGLALGFVALAYFVMFPTDLEALLAPVAAVLRLSGAVATGAYVLLGLLVVAWAVVRVWGRGPVTRQGPTGSID